MCDLGEELRDRDLRRHELGHPELQHLAPNPAGRGAVSLVADGVDGNTKRWLQTDPHWQRLPDKIGAPLARGEKDRLKDTE